MTTDTSETTFILQNALGSSFGTSNEDMRFCIVSYNLNLFHRPAYFKAKYIIFQQSHLYQAMLGLSQNDCSLFQIKRFF